MIVIRYKGGLGNQMFQYAMQLALEKQYGSQHVLADISHYKLLKEHNGYELQKIWNITLKEAPINLLKDVSPYYIPGNMVTVMPKKVRDIVGNNLQFKYKEIKLKSKIGEHYYRQRSHCAYEDEVMRLDLSKNWYLDGLWQSIKYFKGIESRIRDSFQFCNLERYSEQDRQWIEQIKNCNSVSVHVRRGDFTNSKFDICTPDYYHRAMARISREASTRFFMFTDDVEYVQQAFVHVDNKVIIHHEIDDSILDMELMSLCKHHIISNSTFAWWAAWLDEKQDAITIAPSISIKKPDGNYPLSAPEKWIFLEV